MVRPDRHRPASAAHPIPAPERGRPTLMSAPAKESVVRAPGIPHLLVTVLFCFSGFALLLPVSPAWAVEGGADAFGAGLVTAVLMAATVLTQLFVRTMLRRLGWTRTLVLGALLLGLPSLLQALSDHLLPVLLTTALRGAGFGIVTVCGATAAAVLAPRGRRGAVIGLYGLAIALPQVVLTPAAPWLTDTFALPPVIACGVLPVLALPWTRSLGRAVEARADSPASPDGPVRNPVGATALLRRIRRPLAVLLLVTAAGGAVLTFAPQFTATPALAAAGLLALTATAALARWGVRRTRRPDRPAAHHRNPRPHRVRGPGADRVRHRVGPRRRPAGRTASPGGRVRGAPEPHPRPGLRLRGRGEPARRLGGVEHRIRRGHRPRIPHAGRGGTRGHLLRRLHRPVRADGTRGPGRSPHRSPRARRPSGEPPPAYTQDEAPVPRQALRPASTAGEPQRARRPGGSSARGRGTAGPGGPDRGRRDGGRPGEASTVVGRMRVRPVRRRCPRPGGRQGCPPCPARSSP